MRLGLCLDFWFVNLDFLDSLGFPLGCVRVVWVGLHQVRIEKSNESNQAQANKYKKQVVSQV